VVLILELTRKYGYVPLSAINESFINFKFKENAESTITCWKCKKRFEIVGIDMKLNWFAGICLCSYDW
jgi:hypothetical protein